MRFVAAMFCLCFLASACAKAQDAQWRNEVDLVASWRGVGFTMPLLARVDTHLTNPQLAATGITADFLFPWNLTLTGGYLFADLPQRSLQVHLPLVAVTKSFRIRRLTLADHNRFEKLVGFGTSLVRSRNRLLLDFPFGAQGRWHLFADDEIFFDLSAVNWNQNRFQAGGGDRLNQRCSIDVYYLQRDLPGSKPETRVVGTTLRLMLTKR